MQSGIVKNRDMAAAWEGFKEMLPRASGERSS